MNGNTEREASEKDIVKDSKKKMAENKVTAKKKYFSLKKIVFLSHEKLSLLVYLKKYAIIWDTEVLISKTSQTDGPKTCLYRPPCITNSQLPVFKGQCRYFCFGLAQVTPTSNNLIKLGAKLCHMCICGSSISRAVVPISQGNPCNITIQNSIFPLLIVANLPAASKRLHLRWIS